MNKYDVLFDDTAPDNSVFADKGALDPLAEPDEIVAREGQERELATLLNGVHEGYLPTTVSIYGPPGTGKTLTTRRVCREFADQTADVAVEYVNLKECRTLFSAANEMDVENSLRSVGADSVSVEASLNAALFYERIGYERVSAHHKSITVDTTSIEMKMVEMKKKLR